MAKSKSQFKEKPRRVIIRLYRQFDIDLIYMFEYMSKLKMDHQKFVKSVIRSYIDKSYRPGQKAQWISDLLNPPKDTPLLLRRKIQYHVLLDPTLDSDILDWLETITIGYRNTVIKGLMRGFIGEPCVYPCLASTELNFKGTDEQLNVEEDQI
jgi:hypothetical protein